jgi:hypothetical protein
MMCYHSSCSGPFGDCETSSNGVFSILKNVDISVQQDD